MSMSKILEKKLVQECFCYYDLYEPDGLGAKPLLIALHGYGGNKESMMHFARSINKTDYIIVSLQGPHQHIIRSTDSSYPLRYGFGWVTTFKPEESVKLHHDAVLRIIEVLSNERKIDSENIFLLGFSQSVSLNFKFAFTYPNTIRGIIGICGGIPGDLRTNSRYRPGATDVLYIAGERDEIYPAEKILDYAEVIRPFTNSVEVNQFDIDHKIPKEAIPLTAKWIAKQSHRRSLEKE